MRYILILVGAALFAGTATAQVFMTENFDYQVGDLLTDHDWVNHSGSGDFLTVTDNNLTLTGYPLESGNSTHVHHGSGSREDAHYDFIMPPLAGNETIFASMLVNFDSTNTDTNGGYFFHLTQVPHNTSFRGRIFARSIPIGDNPRGGSFEFGVSKTNTSAEIQWEGVSRFLNTTYLLVLKYTIVSGDDNDTVDLYVFDEFDDFSVEPVSPDISSIDTASDIDPGGVNLRQGNDNMGLTVDGIRVAGMWDDLIPVELTSFDANVNGSNINLSWETASETNNAGFEVQLRGDGAFQSMGFVDGHGTTTESQHYSYTIPDLAPGTYAVRLKQIDFDGGFDYSPQVEVQVGVPGSHILTQAYPNPFNPQATFSLSVATEQRVEIGLYNALGQRVDTIFSGIMDAGQARAFTVNGGGLPSGAYYYRAVGENFAETGRVMLLK